MLRIILWEDWVYARLHLGKCLRLFVNWWFFSFLPAPEWHLTCLCGHAQTLLLELCTRHAWPHSRQDVYIVYAHSTTPVWTMLPGVKRVMQGWHNTYPPTGAAVLVPTSDGIYQSLQLLVWQRWQSRQLHIPGQKQYTSPMWKCSPACFIHGRTKVWSSLLTCREIDGESVAGRTNVLVVDDDHIHIVQLVGENVDGQLCLGHGFCRFVKPTVILRRLTFEPHTKI